MAPSLDPTTDFQPTPSSAIHKPNIDNVKANASITNLDPFKFSHGLTGVNQSSNYLFVDILTSTIFTILFFVLCFRLVTATQRYTRRISTIVLFKQKFWESNGYKPWAYIKKYFLYAPILNTRHNREIRLSSAVNMGTLPTRLQFLILVVYTCSNIAYCLAIPKQPETQRLAEFRGRCGALAVFNMIFTILFALRNNPFIWMLNISYDTFSLFHRWTARIVFLEMLAHVFAWMYNTYQVKYNGMKGWHSINWVLAESLSYRWGMAGFVAVTFLFFHSFGPLRHAFYETFLNLHRLSIIVTLAGVYYHLAKHALPQLPWVYVFIAFLAAEPLIRTARILHHNFSFKRKAWTRVYIEALPGEASRVTFELPRSWRANPGSYVHVYLPRIALWSSHPFSVAWSCQEPTLQKESLPTSLNDLKSKQGPTTISCIVRARTGLTRTIYNKASASKEGRVEFWGAVEGPYGGFHSLDSYGTVVLFAAGVGITHQFSFIRHLLVGHVNHTAAAQKILLIWSIQDIKMLKWIQPWLAEITNLSSFQSLVRIRIHVSQSAVDCDVMLPASLDIRRGRCDPQEIVDQELLSQTGAMVVTVCGPGAYSDSVRAAVRRRVSLRSVDFIEEAFSY
ncbi:ferric reductase [Dendryphion nanum]|uniref:Ferric reductase n=1 Tax=Dendryphion nanum TaxID=256645 RepID=A0A9P9IRK6_9PLEO|nr:ferric reductase [Dendryphion nanum]